MGDLQRNQVAEEGGCEEGTSLHGCDSPSGEPQDLLLSLPKNQVAKGLL